MRNCHANRNLVRIVLIALVLCVVAVATAISSAQAAVPSDAARYQGELTRQARLFWGFNAPVATLAGQVHQESHFRSNAQSAYASGLAQFTPDTVRWIAGAYPRELSNFDPWNPAQALRALVIYDLHLYNRVAGHTPCDRMAMALAAYNGGLGWINRDVKLAWAHGADPLRWFGSVENYSARSAAAKQENRAYPRLILLRHQLLYTPWGPAVPCEKAV